MHRQKLNEYHHSIIAVLLLLDKNVIFTIDIFININYNKEIMFR